MADTPIAAGRAGVLFDRPAPAVARVLLDRPERRNAIDEDTVGELRAIAHGVADDAETLVLVIGSSTPGIFSAGADLSIHDEARARVSTALYGLYEQLLQLPAVVIAAIDGPAVGGGAQLAIAADLRVLSRSAWLRFLGPGHGLAVGAWGLPSLVGRGRAMRMCLTGQVIAADTAATIGLADEVCADGVDPLVAAMEMSRALVTQDRDATRRVKRLVVDSCGLVDAVRAEAAHNRQWHGSAPARPT
jgi:enoyl-CoA hydratase/carnithine racemase